MFVCIGKSQQEKDLRVLENRKLPVATWVAFGIAKFSFLFLAVVSQPWTRQTVVVQVIWLLKIQIIKSFTPSASNSIQWTICLQ